MPQVCDTAPDCHTTGVSLFGTPGRFITGQSAEPPHKWDRPGHPAVRPNGQQHVERPPKPVAVCRRAGGCFGGLSQAGATAGSGGHTSVTKVPAAPTPLPCHRQPTKHRTGEPDRLYADATVRVSVCRSRNTAGRVGGPVMGKPKQCRTDCPAGRIRRSSYRLTNAGHTLIVHT